VQAVCSTSVNPHAEVNNDQELLDLYERLGEQRNADGCVLYSKADAQAFAFEVQDRCGQALTEEQLAELADAICLLTVEGPATLAGSFANNIGRLRILEKLGNVGKDSLRLIMAALTAADEISTGTSFSLWCDARSVFRDYLRISRVATKDRTESEAGYLRLLANVLDSRLVRRGANSPDVAAIMALADEFPNFADPVRFMAEQAALSRLRGDGQFRAPPMLFVGPPGIGKTYFAKALAELLGSRVETIGLSATTSGFALSGLDRGWGTAKPGLIYSAIAEGESLAPVIVLDEIDKASTDSRSDPVGPLYQLLEPRTAAAFRDEYVDFGIDASCVAWIATANDVSSVPPALLSRFQVFSIGNPDAEQMRSIADNIYCGLARGLPGTPAAMPEAWQSRLGNRSLRELRIALQQALGRAALRAALNTAPCLQLDKEDIDDIEITDKPTRRIGFIA
jgi:ATP-dependent Lon protease